ncbi:MAG: hypothetical protein JNK45_28995 [Myxococcales bacterium]|nr:hypothetical protein [Myxococcales bacterium]
MTASLVWIGARTPATTAITADVGAATDRAEVPVDARPPVRLARRVGIAAPVAIPTVLDRPRAAVPVVAAAPTRPPRAAATAPAFAPVPVLRREDAEVARAADVGDSLEVRVRQPDGVHVAATGPVEFPSLIAARGDFVPELARVAADL